MVISEGRIPNICDAFVIVIDHITPDTRPGQAIGIILYRLTYPILKSLDVITSIFYANKSVQVLGHFHSEVKKLQASFYS